MAMVRVPCLFAPVLYKPLIPRIDGLAPLPPTCLAAPPKINIMGVGDISFPLVPNIMLIDSLSFCIVL